MILLGQQEIAVSPLKSNINIDVYDTPGIINKKI